VRSSEWDPDLIDELYKDRMDLFWNRFGRLVARVGLTPNMVTAAGIVLCATNAAAFVWHQNFVAFGLLVGLIELLDNVDGAVARVTGASSLYGSYLDAVTDRYKDFFILFAIAWVTGSWGVCTLAIAGSMITSYNAARADALGVKDDGPSGGFPDLFERLERIAMLCVGLVLTPFVAPDLVFGHSLLDATLWIVAIGTHMTAIQRFVRRGRQLTRADLGR
jgi:phosphatidylglycerophosphate synthase